MATDVGIKVKVDGEKTFKTAIQAINQQTKELNAEMKAAVAGMSGMGNSEEQVAQKTRILTSVIEKNREKVGVLSQQYDAAKLRLAELDRELEEAKAKGGDNTDEVRRAETAYNKQAKEVARLGTELNKTNADIASAEAELKKLRNETSNLAKASQNLEKWGTALKDAGSKLKTVGTNLTRYVTTPIMALGTAAVKVTADFDSSMSEVSAISGATGDDLDRLRNKAKEMGESTAFTASEAADAMTYMAMAGWKTNEMLDGLDGIMNLAAASGEDLAQVSDIVTDGLTAFGLSAQDSAHFADVLAQAGRNSNTNVSMLGESFKNVGALAGALGYSIEDVSVALGIMANAGIKSSNAGTALKSALSKLTSPTDKAASLMNKYNISLYNSDGSAKSLMEVMGDLRREFGGINVDMDAVTEAAEAGDDAWNDYAKSLPISDQERLTAVTEIFGARAMPAVLSIINASESDFNGLAAAINNAGGAAAEMAETKLDNLSGQLKILQSKAQGVGISFGEIMVPKLIDGVDKLSDLLDRFKELSPEMQENIIKTAAYAAALGPVAKVAGSVADRLGTLYKAASKLTGIIAEKGGLTEAFMSLSASGAIGLAIGGTAALGIGLTALGNKLAELPPETQAFLDSMEESAEALEEFRGEVDEARKSYGDLQNGIRDNAKNASALADTLMDLVGSYDGTASSAEEIQHVIDQLNEAVPGLNLSFDKQTGALNKTAKAIDNLITKQEREEALQAALARRDDAERKHTEAIEAKTQAQQEYNDALAAVADYEAQHAASLEFDARKRLHLEELKQAAEGARERLEAADSVLEDTSRSLNSAGADVDRYSQELDGVAEATDEIADASGEMADAMEEVSAETAEANAELVKIGNSAIDARYSGENLRDAYDDLTKQLDELQEAGDDNLRAMVEQELEMLNLAATNQELSQAFASMGIGAKENLTQLSAYINDAGISADDFASGVQSVRDSVVNSFKSIKNENAMTAAEMTAVLQENLAIQREWGNNLAALWNSTSDSTVRAYINYLYEQGPEYAAAVAEFANGGYAELETQAYLWADAADLATDQYLQHVYAEQVVAGEAGGDFGQAAADALAAADFAGAAGTNASKYENALKREDARSSGKKFGDTSVTGLKSINSDMKNAAKMLSNGAKDTLTAAAPSFKAAGVKLGQMLVAGYQSQLSGANSTASTMARNMVTAITAQSGQFRNAGVLAGTNVVSGFSSQLSGSRSSASSFAAAMAAGFNAKSATFRAAGSTAGGNIVAGLQSQSGAARSAAVAVAQLAANAVASLSGSFRAAGAASIAQYAGGISAGTGTVKSAAANAAKSGLSGANVGGWYNVGYNMSAGIASGVRGGSSLISSAAVSAARTALARAKSALGIRSPSRVFRDEVGAMIGEGMAQGILAERGTVANAAESLGLSAVNAVNSNMGMGLSGGNTTNNRTYNMTPTIYIYGAEGQSVEELAALVEEQLNTTLIRRL